MPDPSRTAPSLPRNLDEAVERLASLLPLRDKTLIARMSEEELASLQPGLGEYIERAFGLLSENRELMQSLRLRSGKGELHEGEAPAFVIKALWKRLRRTHKLRVVK
jgi:hypothetical protein